MLHEGNLTGLREIIPAWFIDNSKNMLSAIELNRRGLIKDIFCAITSLHFLFYTRLKQ
jgi:hypothetical protein